MALFVKSIQIVCSASTRLVLHIRSIVVDFGMSQDNEKFSKADMKGNALLLQSNAFHFRRHPIIISFFTTGLETTICVLFRHDMYFGQESREV